MRMLDLSPEQRPRERLLAGQGDELSDAYPQHFDPPLGISNSHEFVA